MQVQVELWQQPGKTKRYFYYVRYKLRRDVKHSKFPYYKSKQLRPPQPPSNQQRVLQESVHLVYFRASVCCETPGVDRSTCRSTVIHQ